jgi:hypothetical protein
MGRLCSVCCLCAALVAVLAVLTCEPAAASAVECPRVAFSPVLDSRLDDWPPLPQIVMADPGDWHPSSAEFAQYGGPEDISANVRLAWDSRSLHMVVEVRDDTLVRVRSVAEIDSGDSIVLALVGEDAEVVNQFVVALLKSATLVWRAEPSQRAGEVRTVGRAIAATAEEGEGSRLIYELSIPWSELSQIRPLAGTRFILTVSACDDDGDGLKGCLERPVAVVLSAAGIGPLDVPEPPLPTTALKPTFAAPEVARFDERCFVLNGTDVLILGGEVDYARLPRQSWQRRLDLLRASGFNTVGVTVPWSHHQPTPAAPDLTQLRGFLDLCREAGLWVQLNVGPFVGERWEAGGVPGWVIAAGTPQERGQAVAQWLDAVLALVREYQLTNGGPVAYAVARPIPAPGGEIDGDRLSRLLSSVRSADVVVPLVTANAVAARNSITQPLADLLDTLSLYQPVDCQVLAAKLQTLAREEVGPSAITGMGGRYTSPVAARQSVDQARVALANGGAVVVFSDFAPGLDVLRVCAPGEPCSGGMIDPAGASTAGYGEARLLGSFLGVFGAALARAAPAEGVVEVDSDDVQALVRYGDDQAFLFIWNESSAEPRSVRLDLLEPNGEKRISIPEAGAIHLPARGAKVLPLSVPVGRGLVRYCTSEVAALHSVGERILLVLYGEEDTPGEIAIRLPGPPLVTGTVARQSWDASTRTLTLDYFHAATDQYILVDEIEIAVLSRQRAAAAHTIVGETGVITLSSGAQVLEATLDEESLRATLECPSGTARVTAALSQQPSAVIIDGEPIDFAYTPPARFVHFEINTRPFSEERQATSFWDKLGRAIVGGPPYLYARFDRGSFAPDAEAEGGECGAFADLAGPPEAVGLRAGAFARLRSRFDYLGPAEMVLRGSGYPTLVWVNDQFVPALAGEGIERRADISTLLRPGQNDVELVVHILPRRRGLMGIAEEAARMPRVSLLTELGETRLTDWEVCPGLAGDVSGYAATGADTRGWLHVRLGPWRQQGGKLADVWGVGWYNLPFELPRSGLWRIPYYAHLDLRGAGKVYFNGHLVVTVKGDGEYVLPLAEGTTNAGDRNVLAAALYGLSEETGLHAAEVSADERFMTRQRTLEIRF